MNADAWAALLTEEARANLRAHDLRQFETYKLELRRAGCTLEDARAVLTGWIWDQLELYEADGGAGLVD